LPDGRWVVPANRWDLLDAAEPALPPQVSVVIPYYRAQPQLDLVLTALALQTHPHSRLEVVVADDGSPTAPRVPESATGLDVVVVRQPDHGFRAAAARNLGAGVSSGQVLCFLDADTVPEPDYVQRLARLPALLPDALVTGRRRHANLTGWTPARLRAWLTGAGAAPAEIAEPRWLAELVADGVRAVNDRSYRTVISAVAACSRELFTEVGGFEESFTSYGGEDWELAHRMFTAGAVLAHEHRAQAWHDGPDWAGRITDPATAAAQKQAEASALARLIPEPGARGERGPFPLPDVAVQFGGGDSDSACGDLQRSVAMVLGSVPDVGVWTGAARLAAADPRVHPGAVPADVRSRCRTLVHLSAGCALTPGALPALIELVRPGGPGQVVATATGHQVRVTANRALQRAQRWSGPLGRPEAVLLQQLFGVRTFDRQQLAALGVR